MKKLILLSFILFLPTIFVTHSLFAQQEYTGSPKPACKFTEEWPWEKVISLYKSKESQEYLLKLRDIARGNGEVFLYPDPILADYTACDLGLNKVDQLTYTRFIKKAPSGFKLHLCISFSCFNSEYYNIHLNNCLSWEEIPDKRKSYKINDVIYEEKPLVIGGGRGFIKFEKGKKTQSARAFIVFEYYDKDNLLKRFIKYSDKIGIELTYREEEPFEYSIESLEGLLTNFVNSYAGYSDRLLTGYGKPQRNKKFWQITLICSHPGFESKQNVIGETYMPSNIHITGEVKDEDGNPVGGALVKVMELGASSITDKEGRYKISITTKGEKPFSLNGFDFILQKKITHVGVKVYITGKFIPIPSSGKASEKTPLRIEVVDQDLKPLKRGTISLEIINPEKLSFISIEKDSGFLNEKGEYSTFIVSRRPEENRDYVFLKDIPLKINLQIKVKSQQGGLLGEDKVTFPLGMALLHGWTVGPDMQPRYEPEAPKIYPKFYYLTGQASSEGEFYVLVRIPPDTKFKVKDIYLKWSNVCHLPLELLLKKSPGAGKRIEVRKGKVDILTPAEHEQRIKQWVREFLQAMGFDNGYLGKTLSNLQKLPIRYNVSGASVPHYARGGFESVGRIDIFDSDKEYWGTKAFKGVDPPYTIFFHEMGHFVHKQMVDRWIEACLWDKFYLGAEHSTWRPPEAKTEKGKKITSFYENTADFFAYLMYKFLDQHHPEFKDSIYYDPGYLEDFDTSKKAIAALAYGGCKVEGVQTTFLRELYGNFVKTSPARVFGDYLRTMDSLKEESWVLRWVPARNIGEWVKMKKKNKGIEEGNLNALAKKFRITGCDTGITVYAQGNLTIKINKNSYQLQEGVNGIVSLTPGETIQIKGGAGLIYINDPKGNKTTYLFVKKGMSFQFLSFKEVKVMQGEMAFYGPIVIHTPIATIQPKGTSGVIKVKTNGEVKIQVVEGKVDVETSTDKKELFEGQETLIEKEGKIGLVQPIDQKEIIESFYQDILTSGKTTEESTRVSQDDEEKWRWSDPEGNDHYSIQKGRFYLKINPYQDIWYCNRGGAGLLTTDVPEGDNWSAEVKLHLIKREAATHAGLVIWNGKEKPPVYALYIGLYDTERIRIEGSYSKTCTGWSSTLKGIKENKGNFDEAYKSDTVYLKIEKEKYSYRFYYRPPDSKDWRMLGQIFTRDKFTRIGFIGKSWGGNSLEAIFTDFKLYTSRVPGVFPAGKAPAGTTPKNIIKLYPSADSHVFAYSYRNWNNANWGRWEIIGAGWQIPGGEKRAYLKFDLPKVSCKKATLKLYLYNIGGSNSVALGVYRVVEPWSEGTGTYHSGQVEKRAEEGEITWNNQPSFDPRPVAVFRPPEKVNRWVSVDITPLVKMWLSGNPNYGLMIKMVENPHPGLAESIYNFRSREYKDKTKWPILEIETSRSEKTEVSSIIASVQGSVTLVEKQSKFDFAGQDEKLKGDGRPDTHFRLTLNAPGRSIKWLEIHSTKGRLSAWDTKPDNGMWLVVVAYDGIILNHSDGSFQAILPEGEKVFDLYFQDNGSIAAGHTSYKLTIGFSNGKKCSFPVVSSFSSLIKPGKGQQ